MPLKQSHHVPSQGTSFSLFNGTLSHTVWQGFIDLSAAISTLFQPSLAALVCGFTHGHTHATKPPESWLQRRVFTHRGLLIFSSLRFSLAPTISFLLMASFTSLSLEWDLLAEGSHCFSLALMEYTELSGTPDHLTSSLGLSVQRALYESRDVLYRPLPNRLLQFQ